MGVVKVKKGNEVFEIQDTDLKDAVKDGYLPTDTVIVANSKTKEMFEIAPEDLPDAFSDGFDFSGVKKKVGGIGSAVGGAVGTSVPQSEKQKLTDYLYGLKTKEEKQLAAPTIGITTTLKQKPKKVDEQALNTINTIMYEDSDRWKDPVKSIVEESKNVLKFEDLDVYNRAAELTRNSLAGSGYKAKVLLADTFLNAERDNMTASMLKNRAEQYDKISEPFRNLQFFEGNTITDNPDLDYNAKDKLYDAAIRAYANKYPLFGKQAEAAGIDLSSTDLRRKLGDKGYAGIVMSDILQDKDFVDFVQNENPKYLNVVQNAANDLLKDNREYGINVVANEISKERQKLGLNNPIVEFDDNRFKDETDLVAQKLYGNDPVKMQIYEEVIKRNPDQYLDTPSLIEEISQGAEGVYKGIGTSFEAPFTSISNQIKEGWEKEASNVTADPKGVSKFLSGTGHVLGLVGALGGVGNVIGGGGTGLYSQKIAPFLSGTVPFAGDFWKEAVMKYPDSPAKAALSTTLNTALYGALSQRIFPTKQVQQAFENVKPGIGQIVENLASGKITREVARREANTLIKQGFDFLKGTVSKSAKISAELTGITAANRALDKLFMDEQDFEKYHPEDELQDSFKTLFLDNLVLGGMTKYSDMKKGNAIVEESLYEAATNPLRYKRVIDEMEVKDPTISKENMLANLRHVSETKKALDDAGIPEKSQKRYLFESLRVRTLKEEAAKLPEANLTRRAEAEIKRGEEVAQGILDGKDPDTIVTTEEQKEVDEKAKTDAARNKSIEKGQNAVQKLLDEKVKEGETEKNKLQGIYRDVAKSDPIGFLQEIADQVFGMERQEGERVKSKSAAPNESEMVKRYGADVVNAAKELFPLDKKIVEVGEAESLKEVTTPEGFKNRVFDKNTQIGEPPKDAHISEIGYNYRTLSEKEVKAILDSGGVYAREGKQKGGNVNTKYWTKGNGENWYGDKESAETIRVKDENFDENKVVRASDVEVYNKQTGKFEPLVKSEIDQQRDLDMGIEPVSSNTATTKEFTEKDFFKDRSKLSEEEKDVPDWQLPDSIKVGKNTNIIITKNLDGYGVHLIDARTGKIKESRYVDGDGKSKNKEEARKEALRWANEYQYYTEEKLVSETPSVSVQMPGEVKKPEVIEPQTAETTTPTAPQAEPAKTTVSNAEALPVAAKQAETKVRPEAGGQTKVSDSAKQLADKVRSLKINLSKLGDGGLQSNPLGLPVAVWNGAMDIVAKTIEAGGQVADAVKRGLNYIQKNHRGQWDKKGFNDQVLKELGVRGITVNGQDLIVKDVEPEFAETINGFYSDIEQSILDVSPTDKGTPQAWQKKIGTGEEAKWTGITDWLNSLPKDQKLSRQEILQWLKDNRIQVVEVVKGGVRDIGDSPEEMFESGELILYKRRNESLWFGFPFSVQTKDGKPVKLVKSYEDAIIDQDVIDEAKKISNRIKNTPATKFSQYQLEGQKTNYKEVLVTLPSVDRSVPKMVDAGNGKYYLEFDNGNRLFGTYTKSEAESVIAKRKSQGQKSSEVKFKSSHFDEPNILVHIRMNTRTDADGKKVLFLEEIQSDWGQKGKKEGFNKPFDESKVEVKTNDNWNSAILFYDGKEVERVSRYFEDKNDALKYAKERLANNDKVFNANKPKIPQAPFVTETPSWTKLGLKVALKEAVKQGADKIAWSTGTQQFDRWGSEEIHWKKREQPNTKWFINKNDAHPRPYEVHYKDKMGTGMVERYSTYEQAKNGLSEYENRWVISVNEQKDGAQAFAGNEEALRNSRLSEADLVITNKEELRNAIKRNLARERNDAEIDKLTNRVWDRMQKEESGTSLPRKEGMEAFYGSPSEGKLGIVGEVAKSLFKQEPKTTEIITDSGYDADRKNVDWDKVKVNVTQVKGGAREGLYFVTLEGGGLFETLKDRYFEVAKEAKEFGEQHIKEIKNQSQFLSTQYSIDITPELRQEAESGLPLFKDIKGRGKAIADALRKGKIKMGGLQSNIAGIPAALWNAAIDTIALAIEGGATLAQAVQKAIKKHNLDKQKGFNQKEFISKLEQASGEKLTAETPPVEPPPTEMAGMQEPEQIRLTHADTEQIYDAAGLPLRADTPVKEKEKLEQEAEEILKKGYDFDKVAEETMIGDKVWEDTDQILFARKVADLKAQQKGLDINSPEFDALQKKIEKYSRASDLAGTIGGRFLQSRKHYQPLEETLADYVMQEKEDAKVSVLTEKQKETLQKEFNDIQQAQMFYEQKMQALKEEYEQKLAEAAINNVSKTTKKGQKKDFKKERDEIFASIKDKLKKARSETSVVAVPYAKELIAIAPDVAKLVKSYVEQGITELSEIVKNIKADLGDDKITERDIRGIIAGEYNEQKPTRNKLAADLVSLKQEAKLINQLEEYESGGEPKSETKKIERNRKIDEIKAKLKPYTDLKAYKTKTKTEIEKIQKQMQTGDYSVPQKKPPLKLDKEAMELRDNLIKVKQQREARRLLVQRQNEGSRERALRKVAEVANIPRTLMTIGDFSGLLRQNIFFSAGHPIRTAQALPGMFKAAVSQKEYDRWFADLRESDKYQLIKDSKLAISDSLSHDLSEREEDFMSTLAEKIPIIGRSLKTESGKTIVPGLNIVKGSERSYTMLLNKMRVDVFLNLAEKLENRGITFENSPKVYKALAEYVNNATGRSDFGKHLNRIAPILNSAFFSPRLIASRINMLTYWAQPRFWKTLPKEARIDYFRNWLSLLATGMTILALAKMGGADVEDDPRSSDFGKIKSGNTRWDIWGGAQPYVRVIAQVATGQRKSTNTGKIYELSGDDIFGETRAGVASDFFRNKLAPVPGMMVDVLSGRTSIGDKIVYQWGGAGEKEISLDQYLKQRLLPMTITGTEEAMKDQGTKALFTAGVPQIFGVGTQTYEQKETTTKKPTRKERIQKRREKRQQGN